MMRPNFQYSPLGLGLAATLLPVLAMHLCWLVSSAQGFIDWCVPYWQPCTSISRAGRMGTAFYLFKVLMVPAALLQCFFWWANERWLAQLGLPRRFPFMVMGLVAAIALLVYVMALGIAGEEYHFLRRTGVIVYLGSSFIGLLVLVSAVLRHQGVRQYRSRLIGLCGLILMVALVSIVHQYVAPYSHNRWEDVYEWWLVMSLNGLGLMMVWLWRATKFVIGERRAA
jgi:hypothetical protein